MPRAPQFTPVELKQAVGVLPAFDFRHIPMADGSDMAVNLASHNVIVRKAIVAFDDTDSDYAVERYYNSYNADEAGSMGLGWNLSYGQDVRLEIASDASTVREHGPTGSRVTFTRKADGSYAAPRGVGERLRRNGEGWTLDNAAADTTSHYDAAGYETRREINGGTGFVDTTYSPENRRATTLTDNIGRTIGVQYDTNGRVSAINAQPNGSANAFTYTAAGRLASSIVPADSNDPDGSTQSYYYDPANFGYKLVWAYFYGNSRGGGQFSKTGLRDFYRGTQDGPTQEVNGGRESSLVITDYTPDGYSPAGQIEGTLISKEYTFHSGTSRVDPPFNTAELTRNSYRGSTSNTLRTVYKSPSVGFEVNRNTFAVVRAEGRGAAQGGPETPTAPDTPGPNVTLSGALYSAQDTDLPDGRTTLQWAAGGARGVANVSVSVNGEEVDSDAQDCSHTCSAATGTWTFDTDEWDPGEYEVRVEATDQVGVPSSRSIRFTVPDGPDDAGADPEVDGPELDPATSPAVDGSVCEEHYGENSDLCFEDEEASAAANAQDARLAPNPGTPLTGAAAGTAARAHDPLDTSSDTEAAGVSLSPLSTSTKTLTYGVSQGELAGNSAVPQDTSYFGSSMFTNLKVRNVRVVIPYNLMDSSARVANFRTIYEKALGPNRVGPKTDLMVSLNFRCRPGDVESCYSDSNQAYRPSQASYVKAVSEFKAAFPLVRYISAFNEPNHPGNSPVSTKHAGRTNGPRRAALYTFLAVENVCKKVRAKRRSIPCNIVAGDYAGEKWASYQKIYLADLTKRFARANRKGDMPTTWGFHPYGDVTARRTPSRSQTARFARTLPPGSRLWLTEVGARNHDKPTDKLSDKKVEERQADQVRYLFDELAVSRKNLSRVYYYTLCFVRQAPSSDPTKPDHRTVFDSALLGTLESPSGPAKPCAEQPARSAYQVFKNRSEEAG